MTARRLGRHVRDWEELAAVDPFRAVLRPPERELDAADVFASGERDVDRMLTLAGKHGRPVRFRRALDFGCGIGRLTRALAAHFEEVVGVDASPRMIANATQLNAAVANVRFVEGISPPAGTFDFVVCLLVLQHLPSARSASGAIAALTAAVGPEGVAVFQIPSRLPLRRRIQSRRRLYRLLRALGCSERWLQTEARLDPIRTIALSPAAVESAVESAGGRVAGSEPDDAAGPHIPSRRYVVIRVA